MKRLLLCAASATLSLAFTAAPALAEPGWLVDFPTGDHKARDWMKSSGWEEQKGSAGRWRILDGVLRAEQDEDSTTIGTERGFPLVADRFPMLRYRFRVLGFPQKGNLRKKGTEDAALRVFILFDKGGGLLSPPHTLGYAFGSTEEVGEVITSDRFDHVKYIVVATPKQGVGRWLDIERDIVADYQKAFGTRSVPRIKAIGIKSDANDTDGQATAEVDWIRLDPRG